jgi:hypothetical protein
LNKLLKIGIVETAESASTSDLFWALSQCVVCPENRARFFPILTKTERETLKWIRCAGLRLTIAELAALRERGIRPASELLGWDNRQALTEAIYTPETIFDGLLETLMEKSPARQATVEAVLGLLYKRRVYLV